MADGRAPPRQCAGRQRLPHHSCADDTTSLVNAYVQELQKEKVFQPRTATGGAKGTVCKLGIRQPQIAQTETQAVRFLELYSFFASAVF